MTEMKGIIDDIGILAFESDIKIAALAVISNSGKIIYQTENFNLTNQGSTLLSAIKGEKLIKLNNLEYVFKGTPSKGFIGTNQAGMGYILAVTFEGGILVSYALPQAEPNNALNFLKTFTVKLDGKL